MSGGQAGDPPRDRSANRGPGAVERPGMLDLPTDLLGGWVRVRAPDPAAPFWRGEDGTRHSYQTLRVGLRPGPVRRLREAHLAAIEAIAAAALSAAERGDRRETRRLASAAARLCGEIAGLWPPTAVEVPKR